MNYKFSRLFGVGVFFLAAWADASAASFDCQKASTVVEKMICSSDRLSQLDSDLLISYRKAKAANPAIVESQREWIKGNASCTDTACLEKRYTLRISQLNEVSTAGGAQAPQASPSESTSGVSLARLYDTSGYWVGDVPQKQRGQTCSNLLADSDFALGFYSYQPEMMTIRIRPGGKNPNRNNPMIMKNLNSDIRVPIKITQISKQGDLLKFYRISAASNGATMGEHFELDQKNNTLKSVGMDMCQRCDQAQMESYKRSKGGDGSIQYWCQNN